MVLSSHMERQLQIRDVRISTVVPATATAENTVRELNNMDLAMKLHYIKGVYFFEREAARGLAILDLKQPMFRSLAFCSAVAGRIRRSETGRPFVRCNDSGVRIVEARCDVTMEECLAFKAFSFHAPLVYDHVLGPELDFSPLVFVQFTWFKCGGISVGLSWAHVIGDVFSATTFMNIWGQVMAGQHPSISMPVSGTGFSDEAPGSTRREPVSIKRVDPVGDQWLLPSNAEMGNYSFILSSKQVEDMTRNMKDDGLAEEGKVSDFEALCAIMWKSLANSREDIEPKRVTLCTRNPSGIVVSTVETDSSVAKLHTSELAALIAQKRVTENAAIEETLDKDGGTSDFVLYGANLTFLNMEKADVHGLQLNGRNPVFVNYKIAGVGEEGAVLVLPGPDGGRVVTVVMPENQLAALKDEMERCWGIA